MCSRDLTYLLDELCDISPKWHEFGLALEVRSAKLQDIKVMPGENQSRLIAVLNEWLKGLECSWAVIVKALKKPSIGELGLANKLEKKYCQQGVCVVRYCALLDHGFNPLPAKLISQK